MNLFTAPVLDACLQTWTTPVLGPIWVSKGEGFSPKGVLEFLKGLINYTNSKLKEAKHYKQQLHFAKRDEDRENVEIAAILSMSPAEIDETLEIVSDQYLSNGISKNFHLSQSEATLCQATSSSYQGYYYMFTGEIYSGDLLGCHWSATVKQMSLCKLFAIIHL